jgi:tetratricopeptide (TPR) repeat protein
MKQDKSTKISAFDIDLISRRGNLRQALDLALEAIKKGVVETDLFFIAADMAFQLGDLDKAEQLANTLLVLDPEHVKGWVLFGEIYTRKNDIIRASHARQMAINLFPALAGSGKESADFFDMDINSIKIVNNQKSKANLNFDTITYADICASQGYYNKALKIYQDHLRKNPDDEELKKKIADIEKRLVKND